MPLEPGLVQICLKKRNALSIFWYCFQNFMRSLLFTWLKLLIKCASTYWVACVKYSSVYHVPSFEGDLDMYIPTLEHLFMIVPVMLHFTHKYKFKIQTKHNNCVLILVHNLYIQQDKMKECICLWPFVWHQIYNTYLYQL